MRMKISLESTSKGKYNRKDEKWCKFWKSNISILGFLKEGGRNKGRKIINWNTPRVEEHGSECPACWVKIEPHQEHHWAVLEPWV